MLGAAPIWEVAERQSTSHHHHHQEVWPSILSNSDRQSQSRSLQAVLHGCSNVSSWQGPTKFVSHPTQLPAEQSSLFDQVQGKKVSPAVWGCRVQTVLPPSRNKRYDALSLSVRCNSSGTQSERAVEIEHQKSGQLEGAKRRVVFLGTPEVAAGVLRRLLEEAAKENSLFEITAVVSQPAAKQGRGRKLLPSSVSALALESGLPEDRLLCPDTAREEAFLERLSDLAPDLCVTAAYGNILPNKFLAIPRCGTLNIHPSLLPLYRGASPVQRAIEAGEKVTGVTVAFTVRAMDAGPVLAQEEVEVDPNIKAPELLEYLFRRGTDLLLRNLPSVFDGTAAERATEQDHAKKTEAPKVRIEEGNLDFEQPASVLHNKVRAFAGWPGTKATFYIRSDGSEESEPVTVKVITTRVVEGEGAEGDSKEVTLSKTGLRVTCVDGSILEIQELQPPSKKPMRGRDFWNGLRGRRLYRGEVEAKIPY
ncbi:methionyl-tRNA formyltransferase [Klebsormidium nitens]|uniref:Methionyl-tRNA formyltransferase, mitochondrial n=1 Tax=Klebsormidium nitens TaxID=105231 RepID=A0A1Y1ICX7_KLENI|nr:methionyl-tRNA formyltransferase [Klebsormidium nitens]|eukprot:GAQ88770.1 methionyl-tRNA formyltransferase [Klebsormidium nitens]